jgi:hypothetical protein
MDVLRTVVTVIGCGAFLATSQLASADTVTQIDLSSYYNGNWNTTIDGLPPINSAAVAAGAESGTGNTGSGLTFSDPTGGVVDLISYNPPVTISGLDIALNSNAAVQSLFNNYFGDTTPANAIEAIVVFTNSDGATATYSLEAGQTIRDYNNDDFVNTLGGSNVNPADGNVTALNWWNTGDASSNLNGQPSQRLDAQIFALPTSWNGTDLTSITITDPAGNIGQDVLSAIQVDDRSVSPTPEPSETLLLTAGLAALAFFARRRRKAA